MGESLDARPSQEFEQHDEFTDDQFADLEVEQNVNQEINGIGEIPEDFQMNNSFEEN